MYLQQLPGGIILKRAGYQQQLTQSQKMFRAEFCEAVLSLRLNRPIHIEPFKIIRHTPYQASAQRSVYHPVIVGV